MYSSLIFLNSLNYADYNKKAKIVSYKCREPAILAYNNDFRSNLVKMDEIRLALCENFEYDIIAISDTGLVNQPKMTVVTFICPIIPYSVKIVKLLTAEVEG